MNLIINIKREGFGTDHNEEERKMVNTVSITRLTVANTIEIEDDLLEMEYELNYALELVIQLINDGEINGCDLVDNNTGEVLFIFNGSTVPAYNATDIRF